MLSEPLTRNAQWEHKCHCWKFAFLIALACCSGIAIYGTFSANAANNAANKRDTAFLAAAAATGDDYRIILALDHLPPYWLMLVSTGVKTSIMTLLFGIPTTHGTGAGVAKHCMAGFFAAVSVCGALTDIHRVQRILTAEHLMWWAKVNGCAVAFCISGNLQTYAAMQSLYAMYVGAWTWRDLHDAADTRSPEEFARKYQSSIWWWWYRTMRIYFSVFELLLWFYFPVMFVYVWLTVGLMVIGFGSANICVNGLLKVIVKQKRI